MKIIDKKQRFIPESGQHQFLLRTDNHVSPYFLLKFQERFGFPVKKHGNPHEVCSWRFDDYYLTTWRCYDSIIDDYVPIYP